jgi:ribosomal protein L11 methyltransferase
VPATDIDPIATTVARQNARLNGVAASIEFATAPGFHAAIFRQRGRFDLIIANILAKPLMQMAPQMNAHLARGGTLVLSGILAGQRRKVLAAYATQGLFHRETLWRNGWVTIRLGRQNP